MNIFGSDLMTRDNWNQVGSHANTVANHAKEADAAGSGGQSGSVSSLQPGQVFQGEILDITSKNVTIRLDNQQVLQARLGESVELNIGQKMYFEVKENQGEQVFIRPMEGMNNGAHNLAAEKALTANGFSFTERNFQIANELMRAGMPLDKESMRRIMQQSMKFPDVSIKNLVSLNQLGIPVNDANVAQFETYVAHEHQMTSAMNSVLDGFESALMEITQNGSLDDMQDMNRQLIHMFGWGEDTGEVSELSGNAANTGEVSDPSGNAANAMNITENTANGKEAVVPANENPAKNENIQSDKQAGSLSETVSTVNTANSKMTSGTSMDSSFLQSIQNQLTELGMPEEHINQLMDQSKNYGELIANLNNYFAKEAELPEGMKEDAAKSLFQSESFRKLLRKGIQEEWLMKPEDMKNPKEIDELYKKILQQSSQLEQSLNFGDSASQQFSRQAQNMRENILFMQQLNEQFVFAQMPMNVNGEEANSELFVYVNKKKLQQSVDGVKVLLHLDMPNLGSTDILVRLKDNMLHAKFTLEDNTSVSVIADNMQDLAKKLEDKGFHFTNEVKRMEPPTDAAETEQQVPDAVVDEMLNQDLITGVKRYTFDIRG